MIGYNVHNLVDVMVEDDVPAELAEAIDFQLNHFARPLEQLNCPLRILVGPYERFSPPPPAER